MGLGAVTQCTSEENVFLSFVSVNHSCKFLWGKKTLISDIRRSAGDIAGTGCPSRGALSYTEGEAVRPKYMLLLNVFRPQDNADSGSADL